MNGVQWFKDRGQWIDGSAEPVPGMIIFFDWDNKGSSGPQDGQSDHTGIVQKVENGIVYTVEGKSGDSCRVNQYSVGHYEILGYGVPNYKQKCHRLTFDVGRWLFFVYRLHFLRGSYKHNNEIIIESGEKVPFENKRIADEIIDNGLIAYQKIITKQRADVSKSLINFFTRKIMHC